MYTGKPGLTIGVTSSLHNASSSSPAAPLVSGSVSPTHFSPRATTWRSAAAHKAHSTASRSAIRVPSPFEQISLLPKIETRC